MVIRPVLQYRRYREFVEHDSTCIERLNRHSQTVRAGTSPGPVVSTNAALRRSQRQPDTASLPSPHLLYVLMPLSWTNCTAHRCRHTLGASGPAALPPPPPQMLAPMAQALAGRAGPAGSAAGAGYEDSADPNPTPSYARPSAWPAINGDPAATPPRGRLRLQLRASTAQAPRGRTFWHAPYIVPRTYGLLGQDGR